MATPMSPLTPWPTASPTRSMPKSSISPAIPLLLPATSSPPLMPLPLSSSLDPALLALAISLSLQTRTVRLPSTRLTTRPFSLLVLPQIPPLRLLLSPRRP